MQSDQWKFQKLWSKEGIHGPYVIDQSTAQVSRPGIRKRSLNHDQGPNERKLLKERVRYETEFLKERWFSQDAKDAMAKFVNKKK